MTSESGEVNPSVYYAHFAAKQEESSVFKISLAAVVWLSPKIFTDHNLLGHLFVCCTNYFSHGHPKLKLVMANSGEEPRAQARLPINSRTMAAAHRELAIWSAQCSSEELEEESVFLQLG